MSDETNSVETAQSAAVPPVRKVPRPVLVTNTLLVEVVAVPPAGTPFGEYRATVQPFNRKELAEFYAATRPFLEKDTGVILDKPGYAAKELELLTPRIRSWDAEYPADAAGQVVIAPINRGTVEVLPPFAFEAFLGAALGAGGQLLGN